MKIIKIPFYNFLNRFLILHSIQISHFTLHLTKFNHFTIFFFPYNSLSPNFHLSNIETEPFSKIFHLKLIQIVLEFQNLGYVCHSLQKNHGLQASNQTMVLTIRQIMGRFITVINYIIMRSMCHTKYVCLSHCHMSASRHTMLTPMHSHPTTSALVPCQLQVSRHHPSRHLGVELIVCQGY